MRVLRLLETDPPSAHGACPFSGQNGSDPKRPGPPSPTRNGHRLESESASVLHSQIGQVLRPPATNVSVGIALGGRSRSGEALDGGDAVRRREFIALAGAAVAVSGVTHAQSGRL